MIVQAIINSNFKEIQLSVTFKVGYRAVFRKIRPNYGSEVVEETTNFHAAKFKLMYVSTAETAFLFFFMEDINSFIRYVTKCERMRRLRGNVKGTGEGKYSSS